MADTDNYTNYGVPNARHSGHLQDSVGHTFPWVRIKDYELRREEIEVLELKSSDILPTIHIKVRSSNKMFEHQTQDAQRKIISVFVRQDLAVYKPIQCDFVVTSMDFSDMKINQFEDSQSDNSNKNVFTCDVYGVLYVPAVNSSSVGFHINDTPDNALRKVASILNLGFSKSIDTSTGKSTIECVNYQPWDCFTDPFDFIGYATQRMWKDETSFFQSWIDFYYNLTVVNVGRTLDGEPNEMRATWSKFQTTVATYEHDGALLSNDFSSVQDSHIPKILTNYEPFQTSSFYVFKYKMVNQNYLITEEDGIQNNLKLHIDNRGIGSNDADAQSVTIASGVSYNRKKLESGDYAISSGDARASSDYTRNVVQKNNKFEHTNDIALPYNPVMATPDVSNIDNRSGNIHQMTTVGYTHNMLNNRELEKQYVEVELKGLNLSLVRGDRVPMWIFERGDYKYLKNNAIDKSFEVKRPLCGEFYINEISYVYEPDDKNGVLSSWNTELVLTRKEWLTPEPTASQLDASEFYADGSTGSTVSNETSPDTSAGGNPTLDPSAEVSPEWTDPLTDADWQQWLQIWASDGAVSDQNSFLSMADDAASKASACSDAVDSATDVLNTINNLI